MVNNTPLSQRRRSIRRNSYLRAAGNTIAAQFLRNHNRMFNDGYDSDDEGMPSLRGFNLSIVPRNGSVEYIDAQGNINELWYGVGGRLHHAVRRGGLVTRPMGEEPTSAPSTPVQRNRPRSLQADVREPEDFNIGFLTLEDPFDGSDRRSTVGGLGRRGDESGQDNNNREEAEGLSHGAVFAAAIEFTLMPHGTGISSVVARGVANFIQHYTEPVSEDDDDANQFPPNTECPICLQPPSSTHGCVQIRNVPGCSHLIGLECLEQLLMNNVQSKKECPLCRTEWVTAGTVLQMSREWQRISRRHNASPCRRQNPGEFDDGSPRDRLADRVMVGPHPPHDDPYRGDRRPGGHPPVNRPEAYSLSAGRGGRTRVSDRL